MGENSKAKWVRATVMFADVVGFSELSERAGAEAAYFAVTGALRLLEEIARRHGGSVDKYLGDSVMVVFGHPVPVPDAPGSAVSAALEMRAAIQSYRAGLSGEPPIDVLIGINTGSMVAGDVHGRVIREFHVLGDCVNVAARLKAKAPLGGIYAGPDTFRETERSFDYRAHGQMNLKGIAAPVPIYEPVRRRSGSSGAEPAVAAGGFVGRQAQLARVRGKLEALVAGTGGVLAVVGEEGAGKTRLVAEALRGASAEKVVNLRASANPYGDSGHSDDPDDSRDPRDPRGWQLWREFFAAIDAQSPGPPTSPELAGVPATEDGSHALGLVAKALVDRAKSAPLVAVLEDLELADPASLRLLAGVVPFLRDEPVLFILTWAERKPDPLSDLRDQLRASAYEELFLPPLSDRDSRALIDEASEERLPEESLALVLERGAGNPGRLLLSTFLAPALRAEQQLRASDQRPDQAERRRATILFADISGFTAMTERLGAEHAYPIVVRCLRLLEEIARKHGGSVEKHLGDCVMALFGVPEALEDAPRAASNAAIEMRRRVRELNAELGAGTELDVHSGINTGTGIAGDISGPLLREFAVMGDPVDIADRLADLAGAGEIYVGGEVERATRGTFAFRELEAVRLKGRSQTVPAFALTSQRERVYRSQVGSGRRVYSSLVGREDELGTLLRALDDVSQGHGGIVNLIGEAGLGKSRLLRELSSSPSAASLTWLEGRSLSNGSRLPFHPFADLFRSWAAINDDDDDQAARDKVQQLVERIAPREPLGELLPFLASVMSLPLAPDERDRIGSLPGDVLERLIRNSMTQLVLGGAELQPVVMVMEDLHWADVSSVELLESLLGGIREHPLLFVHVARPGYDDTSERIRRTSRESFPAFTQDLVLRPLNAADFRSLIGNLFRQGDLPYETRQLIEEKAQGNPFYIEEVIRSLVDDGAVVPDEGRFRATEKIHQVSIPGTVQEVIMVRVDALRGPKRQLLQTASVIGGSFHADVLADVVGGGSPLQGSLAELLDAEFLVPSDRLPGLEYAFKHPLIQEVTYDGILETQRQELHRRVAEGIERRLSEDIPGYFGMLAYHYSMGRDLARAERFLFKAGDEAARVAASAEALDFFRRALELYFEMHGGAAEPAQMALLERKISRALFNRGQLIEASEYQSQALRHLGERVPRSQRALAVQFVANLCRVLARLYLPLGWLPRPKADPQTLEAIELMFERAQGEATADATRFLFDSIALVAKVDRLDPESVPGAGGIYAGVSVIFSYGGVSFGIARRFLNRAQRLVDPNNFPEYFRYRVMNYLNCFFEGDWRPEHQIEPDEMDRAVQIGLLWDALSYLAMSIDQKTTVGDYEGARSETALARQLWDRYGHDLARSTYYGVKLFVSLESGEVGQAIQDADEYYEENPEELLRVTALGAKAKALVLAGQLVAASDALHQCEKSVKALGGASRVTPFQRVYYERGRLLLSLARFEEALDRGDRVASAEYRARGRRDGRAALQASKWMAQRRPEILRLLGRLEWLSGRPRRACNWWRQSLELSETLGARPEWARTHAEIALRLPAGATVPGLDGETSWKLASQSLVSLGLEREAAALESRSHAASSS